MSNNHLLVKELNQQMVSNIFSSLIGNKKWEMLIEMFKLKILDINSRDEKGKNALYWAIKENKLEIIKELLNLGINTSVSANLSALNFAVYLDNIKVLKCLKNCGICIDEIDSINSTPLIYAILFNKQNSIKYLVENGANLEHEDFLGNSPRSLAFSQNIDYLMKKFS